MILLSKPFTRGELYELLREAAVDALRAERPELLRLESAIIHAEIALPQTGPYKGGAVVEFTIAEPMDRDLPGQRLIFEEAPRPDARRR